MTTNADKPLAGYEVLLAVTGGIACYKVADLTSKLVQSGAGVSVAMTDSATKFIAPLTFQAITGRAVYTSIWDRSEDFKSQHLSLSERADLMIIAPATANIIAKMAGGIADDLVSTLALSAQGSCDILLAPAMNDRMYSAAPTQRNIQTLTGWGIKTVGPETGYLACGTEGVGRMSEPLGILASASELLLASPPKKLST